MELDGSRAATSVRRAFSQMLAVADRLGDERVNERPLGPRTNAVAELHTMGARTLATIGADLGRIVAGDTPGNEALRQFLPDGDESDAALVLHVLEELYQHLGHMELAADALLREI